jgi:hypothetical protein
MNPARLDELRDAVDVYFLFAERMIDQAFFELTQGRPAECRVMVGRAIEQLDRALKQILKSERMG